jgi:hypothetical protein
MATSPTDIANLALSEIGSRLIASLETENSEEARVCRLHYPQCRDALLRQHQWSFATARADLSKLDAAPLSDWDSAWQLPADCLRNIRISSGSPTTSSREFAVEGRSILTRGMDAVSLVYVTNAAAVPDWDSLFVEAMSYLLASKIAGPITQSPSIATDMLQKFRSMTLPAAETADASESQAGEVAEYRRRIARSALCNSRFRN